MGEQNYIKPLLLFALYISMQALFGQNMVIGHYAFCFFYVGSLISMPFETSRVLFLIIAFITGLAVDTLHNSMGMHISACLLLAYLREPVKLWIAPRGGYNPGMEPSLKSMGFSWLFAHSSILIFIHHLVFFTLEASNFALWKGILLKTLLSTAYTLCIVLIIKSLNFSSRK